MGYDCRTRKNSENVKQREKKFRGGQKKIFFALIKVVMIEIYSQGTKEAIISKMGEIS